MNAPALMIPSAGLEFDVDDPDGRVAMLDREFAGALVIPFTIPMDHDVAGTVHVDGHEVEHLLKSVPAAPGMSLLGIRLFGVLTEPGSTHRLSIRGFQGIDGIVMDAVTVPVTTRANQPVEERYEEHEAIALRVAEEGIVLLENRNSALPLAPGELNVFGSALHAYRTAVGGAGNTNDRHTTGLRDAVRASSAFTLNEELADHVRRAGDAVPAADILERARTASDTGIVVLSRISGENMDNSSDPGEFALTATEDELIRTVAETFARSVVILNTPYPIDVSFMEKYSVDALLLTGIGGMLAGPAIVHVLDGTVNPSGRLTDTWARSLDDIPAHANFFDAAGGATRYTADHDVWVDTVYEEGIYVGYRYSSTFGVPVAYPFGHGLGYTEFVLRSEPSERGREVRAVAVEVTNKGGVAGRDVVQLYVSKPPSPLEVAALELADFAKTRTIEPGASEVLRLAVPEAALASWDVDRAAFVAAAGEYVLRVGHSVADTVEVGRFVLSEPMVIRQGAPRMLPLTSIETLSQRDPAGTFPCGTGSGVKDIPGFRPERAIAERLVSQSTAPTGGVTFDEVLEGRRSIDEYVAQLSVEELARLVVCSRDDWGMEGTGVAGILATLDGRDLPALVVADGNSGVNVNARNIGMPATVVLASTFDRDLARAVGRVIGEEAREQGVDLILAPGMNLHRHPLNGRHPEYFSEDPLLTGVLAAGYAEGLESAGVGACYKHVLANNAETSRKRNQSLIPERALRELYLNVFEIALRLYAPATLMTSYNAVNGLHPAADAELIDGVLREELGFSGAVMTDWNAYATVDVVDMIRGGTSWITPGSEDDRYTGPIFDAVERGDLDVALLRESASRIVSTLVRLHRLKKHAQDET